MTLDFTPMEQLVVDDIRSQGAFSSDADVIRVALWMYAHHFDIACPPEAFEIPFRPGLQRLIDQRERDTVEHVDDSQGDLFQLPTEESIEFVCGSPQGKGHRG